MHLFRTASASTTASPASPLWAGGVAGVGAVGLSEVKVSPALSRVGKGVKWAEVPMNLVDSRRLPEGFPPGWQPLTFPPPPEVVGVAEAKKKGGTTVKNSVAAEGGLAAQMRKIQSSLDKAAAVAEAKAGVAKKAKVPPPAPAKAAAPAKKKKAKGGKSESGIVSMSPAPSDYLGPHSTADRKSVV